MNFFQPKDKKQKKMYLKQMEMLKEKLVFRLDQQSAKTSQQRRL